MSQPIRNIFDLGGKVRVSPSIWLDESTLDVQPGDLSTFVPHGNRVYGYQARESENPFLGAPPQEGSGGVVYFDNRVTRADFDALMRMMEVHPRYTDKPRKEFAAFTAESEQPGKDGYIFQMRLVSPFGLRFLFGAITEKEMDRFPEQDLGEVDALWAFVEHERARWGTSFRDDKGLAGMSGGDGDFAREELAFGFMVENGYNRVYRIWSRAWLVTK